MYAYKKRLHLQPPPKGSLVLRYLIHLVPVNDLFVLQSTYAHKDGGKFIN